MEANPKNVFTIQVEDGKPGKDGRPAVGPVFRSALAKDGFPPLEPDMKTSWDVFRIAARKYPDNRMLGWRPFKNGMPGPYLWKSYKEVYEEVLQVGSALQQLGVQPGSRVGIYGTNCPQWIVAMQACNGYSLICVPLYDTLGAGAVDYIIDHAEIDVVFIQDKKIKEILSPNCKSAKRLKALVSFTSATSEQLKGVYQIGMKMYSWNDFLKLGKDNPAQPCPPQANDTCTIMYTSGTSGQPKGVMLSHESHAMYVKGVDLFMDQFDDKMTTDDVFLSFLPLAHILDRMIEEYFFHKGASVGYYHGDLNALRDDLMELKPTLLVGVPRVYERIHEGILKAIAELRPLRRVIFNALYNRKLASMKAGYSHKTASPFADMLAFRKVKARLGGRLRLLISGGAPLSNEIEEFLRVTSCAYFIQGYGLTETLGPSTVCYPDDMALVGTVGVAATYTDIRLEEVPEMGYDPLGIPSRGEICIRGKSVFSGYYKNPELTNEAIVDGWFHTGDIGEMTPDGILKVIDRKKNIFKLSQGEYVAVEYLEKVYGFPPLVEDIWVYGDSFRSNLVAVVNPHEENTMKWAESNGYSGSFDEICKLEGLKEYILKELTVVAQKNKLRGFEYIKGIVLDPTPFDIERDLVTATMKKKRNNMLKYYQSEVDKLYKKLEEQKNAAKAK
ncbi:long chain acyl-CoA synthetase 1-like [Phragmites australis]|uniref:long chain acyl-CoA synthetase 1-like n=1 Tax=Phragmites australis TaxID=29695 RepID=UPI002D792368|nr:long chain acyl-CoA synthetase 1-like [Phragmites australis]